MKQAEKTTILVLLLFTSLYGYSQKPGKASEKNSPRIISGPMMGYLEHRETLIWLQTECAKTVTVNYSPANQNSQIFSISLKLIAEDPCKPTVSKIILKDLVPGTGYNFSILLDGKKMNFDYPLFFETKSIWEFRTDPPPFSFITGSCNYINDSIYDRPGVAFGKSPLIFNHMASSGARFMIWLGDNTYLREADYSSESAIRYRYLHTRKTEELRKLLGIMHHYATWDDHDFGPNDANSSFSLKNVTRDCFTSYWGNKTFGESGNNGIYSMFSFSDADFFLTDGRSFRDDYLTDPQSVTQKKLLGSLQMEWLKNSLMASKATFKFIVTGNQFLNENTDKESFNFFREEREELLKFISQNKIKGVIFISGDRHHTEILKKERTKGKKHGPADYPLYELTCSPLTAASSNVLTTAEAQNPMRVPGTLVVDQNYCQLFITGLTGERVLRIKCFDKNNALKWEFSVSENEIH